MPCPGYRTLDLDVCPQITQLKIAANPFAKGFRENGRNCKRWASFNECLLIAYCVPGTVPGHQEHDGK